MDGDAGDAESGGVCDPVAGVAQNRDEFVEVTALDDAEAGGGDQHQDGRDDAGAVRKVTLEKRDQPVRPFALQGRSGGGATGAQPLATQRERADGGPFHGTLVPPRSQAHGDASSTIPLPKYANCGPKTPE